MPIVLHKRKTSTDWSTANPVLQASEIGIELQATGNSPLIKIGDGATAWNALPYAAITMAQGDTRYILSTARGAANGVAPLNGSGKIDSAYLGSLRIVNVATVADQTARLALAVDDDAQFVVQSSTSETYMLGGGVDPSVNGNWIKLPSPNLSGYQTKAEKDAANGYAGLDASTKLNPAQLPTIDGNTA